MEKEQVKNKTEEVPQEGNFKIKKKKPKKLANKKTNTIKLDLTKKKSKQKPIK